MHQQLEVEKSCTVRLSKENSVLKDEMLRIKQSESALKTKIAELTSDLVSLKQTANDYLSKAQIERQTRVTEETHRQVSGDTNKISTQRKTL